MDYIRPMNVDTFDLNLLRVLDALLSESAVNRAAIRLRLSQPAVSHALRRLRLVLEDPLLVRVGSKMELTSRARTLREPVAQALAAAHRLFEGGRFDPATSRRRFVLMASDIVVSLIAPTLTERVRRAAPDVSLEIVPWRGHNLLTEEFLRSVDAATSNRGEAFPGFRRQTLYEDRDVLAVRRGHPIGSKLRTSEGFLAARHIAVVGRGNSSDQIDDWLATLGVERRSAIIVPSYLQALHIAAETDLVAFVPRRLVVALAGRLQLVAIRPPFDPGVDEQFLFYPATAQQDPASLWFRSVLKDVALGRAGKA
jgi:DNA-binding transcriptional LysR family regulator